MIELIVELIRKDITSKITWGKNGERVDGRSYGVEFDRMIL